MVTSGYIGTLSEALVFAPEAAIREALWKLLQFGDEAMLSSEGSVATVADGFGTVIS